MCVSVAQNANENGLNAMNCPEGTVQGRGYAEGDYSYSYSYAGKNVVVDMNKENAYLYGLNFQQQWDYAIEQDPDVIFVTGFNEWIAGRWENWMGTENAFPDQYNPAYSREIEPWKYALHAIRLWHDPEPMRKFGINTDGSTRDIKRHHDEYRKAYAKWYIAEVLKSEDEYEVMRQKLQERIDKESDELRQYLLRALNASGLKQSEVGQRLGTQMQGHYFGRSQWAFPTKEYYEQMQTFMPLLNIPYDKIETLAQLKVDIDTLSQADSVQKPKRLWECDSEERNNRLRSLESLGSLDRLNVLHGDYASVVPESGSVIYLDPPYRGTSEYNGIVFNHERFYEWIERQTERGCFVFISEYDMPSNRFSIIAETSHRSRLSASANMAVRERLFVPIHQEYKNEQAQLTLF